MERTISLWKENLLDTGSPPQGIKKTTTKFEATTMARFPLRKDSLLSLLSMIF